MLTSDYLLTKAGTPASSSTDPVPDVREDGPAAFKWLVGASAPGDVKVESKWKVLQCDNDILTKNMFLRGRIASGLQALLESLPKFSEKDFVVAHRKNDKGIFKTEIWTKRDFEPLEIMLAPWSSQLKDSHLMVSAHAVVTLPKHGRGAHPENGSLALDGRTRNLMASAGTIDKDEHVGSLYWSITRTSVLKEVNMEIEQATWQQKIQMHLPGPASKKRKVDPIEWEPSELPSFPILLNKKAIKKHTKLCVYLADKKIDKKTGKEKK